MYPKNRPPLPKEYHCIYKEHLLANRAGQGLAHKMTSYLESWMHKQVSNLSHPNLDVLEIGAGNLNHIKFEQYSNYDMIEPCSFLYEGLTWELKKIRHKFFNIDEIESIKYDRVISIAVLEHVEDLPSLLEISKQLLKEKGVFQAAIPTEGGFLWFLASKIVKGFLFKLKYGLDYKVLMAHEHLNSEKEILSLIEQKFTRIRVKRFPTSIKHLSLYTYVEAS